MSCINAVLTQLFSFVKVKRSLQKVAGNRGAFFRMSRVKRLTETEKMEIVREAAEGVSTSDLARRFGAVDGHKYINAVLDRAVKKYRPDA